MGLSEEIIRLGPWHLDVEVTPQISTGVSRVADSSHDPALGVVSFINPRNTFVDLVSRIYPDGLTGRRVLDCACNCGGYLFWASELGAAECFGFDVREHWIRQARFLQENRTAPGENIRFEICDLYDVPKLDLGRHHLTIFKGLFYHLPDPIAGLKIAADLTEEVLILDTATKSGLPDGLLAIDSESTEQLMSGVHGLNWFPTGPQVLTQILNWLGFSDVRCRFWNQQSKDQPRDMGRISMIAARESGHLDGLQPPQID